MKRQILTFILAIAAAGCATNAQTRTPGEHERAYRSAADYSRSSLGLSVLVMRGDKVVFEEYHNGHSAEEPWMLASETKSFSGVMLAAAIEDKIVSGFDEKVSDTITEWKSDPRKSKITLRQLLSLTGGLEAGPNGRPPEYAAAVRFPARYEPGEKFAYGPVPFQVFGEVMRRKLKPRNETVAAYLQRRVFDPIGMRVARWNSKDGGPNLPSGAHATAREWVKFGLLLKNGGRWNGKQIVSGKLLEELTVGSGANRNYGLTFWLNRSHSGEAEIAGGARRLRRLLGGDEETGVVAASRYGVDAKLPNDLYMAAGGGNQRLYIIPSHDLVVVRQGRLGEWDDREFLTLLLTGRSAK